jgi:hypothetical protein
VMDPLCALAEQSGAAIIVVAHLNKSDAAKAIYRIAGSVGYTAAGRLAYLIAVDPEDEDRRLLLPVKANLLGVEHQATLFGLEQLTPADAVAFRRHPALTELSDADFTEVVAQMARVQFDGTVEMTVEAVMRSARKDKKDPNKVARCAEWLKLFLAEFAYPSQEILDAALANGYTFDNVKEAKAQLKTEGLRNSNRGQFRGEWWSGFGEPRGWKLRPEPQRPVHNPSSEPRDGSTDDSSATTSDNTPAHPHIPESPESGHSGESGENAEIKEEQAKVGNADGKTATAAKKKRTPKPGRKKRLLSDGDERDTIRG